jgi:hypothetical protein
MFPYSILFLLFLQKNTYIFITIYFCNSFFIKSICLKLCEKFHNELFYSTNANRQYTYL